MNYLRVEYDPSHSGGLEGDVGLLGGYYLLVPVTDVLDVAFTGLPVDKIVSFDKNEIYDARGNLIEEL